MQIDKRNNLAKRKLEDIDLEDVKEQIEAKYGPSGPNCGPSPACGTSCSGGCHYSKTVK